MGAHLIQPLKAEHAEYLRDESRTVGAAETISFPRNEAEVSAILKELHKEKVPVTVQGARTGLAAAAVPKRGHILNLSKMDRVLALRQDEGRFFLTVQPGLALLNLRKMIASCAFDTEGWDEVSLAALENFRAAPEHFFPTDPTEATASIGGMTACNASGARSYLYGPMRSHVTAVRAVLADGSTVALRRGEQKADGLSFTLVTEQGGTLHGELPDVQMPPCKNTSGYFMARDMDLIDLLIGSDGTLAVVTAIELELLPLPSVIWGVTCFFPEEDMAANFVEALRPALQNVAALEYFDPNALRILNRQREHGGVFARLPDSGSESAAAVYAELHCAGEGEALASLRVLGAQCAAVGGDPDRSWVGRTAFDKETMSFFRHAVPESVNMFIDQRKKTAPGITKLGSDMAVPNGKLLPVMELYHRTLAEEGFEYAIWGHIGNNHVHVNILPRSMEEYHRGKALFTRWAAQVTAMGGAVSAEHGVGKLKASFLPIMFGSEVMAQMAQLKHIFDPRGQLGQGNLFGEEAAK